MKKSRKAPAGAGDFHRAVIDGSNRDHFLQKACAIDMGISEVQLSQFLDNERPVRLGSIDALLGHTKLRVIDTDLLSALIAMAKYGQRNLHTNGSHDPQTLHADLVLQQKTAEMALAKLERGDAIASVPAELLVQRAMQVSPLYRPACSMPHEDENFGTFWSVLEGLQ